MVQTSSIHVRLPPKLYGEIKKILDKGYYTNINDFIKEAVREKVLMLEVPEEKLDEQPKEKKTQFHYVH